MTSTSGRLDNVLMALFAETNRCMSLLRTSLGTHPAVDAARNECDISRYHDVMKADEQVYCFESFVEVDRRDEDTFWWTIDMSLSSSGWTIDRHISKQGQHGRESVVEFDQLSFKSIDEIASRHAALMQELVESANDFDFSKFDDKAPRWRTFWKRILQSFHRDP